MAWIILMVIGILVFLIGLISFFVYDEQEKAQNFRDIAAFMAIGDVFLVLSARVNQNII